MTFSPSTYFAAGEQGFWLDVQDLATMFQDTGGTVAAVVGQPVARINDKSGRGNHAAQASASQRPILRQHATTNKYYLEFDGVDDNLTTSVAFGSIGVLSVFAALRNREETEAGGLLELTGTGSLFRLRERSSASTTIWDALLTAGTDTLSATDAATANTTAPNDMVLSTQHNVAGDLSTIRVNGTAGNSCLADKGSFTLGTMDVNVGKLTYRTGVAADLYGLIVRGALTADPTEGEAWLDAAMGGGVIPAPTPPIVYPQGGFGRKLGAFPWMTFCQPSDQFTFWSDVGVHVLDSWTPAVSGHEDYVYADLGSFTLAHQASAEAWDSAAITAGFKLARFPYTSARATADMSNADVIGWPVYDEPELATFDIGPQLALLDAADPTATKVRAMNNTGGQILYRGAEVRPYIDQFADYPYVQPGFDTYPVQFTESGKEVILLYQPSGAGYTGTANARALVSARETEWSSGWVNHFAEAPYAVFIATGGFTTITQTELRVPTPLQVRFQIADAIVMGAGAISFFPQRLYGYAFDSHNATPSDVKAQLTTTIGLWQQLETRFAENLLIDPTTGDIWPATFRVCPDTSPSGQQETAESGWTFAAPPSVEYLPGPFQGSVRAVPGVGNVYFVQNLANAPASLTDATWGFSSVAFAARETLVFIEGDMVNAVWSDIGGLTGFGPVLPEPEPEPEPDIPVTIDLEGGIRIGTGGVSPVRISISTQISRTAFGRR